MMAGKPVLRATLGALMAAIALPVVTQSSSMSIEIMVFAIVVLGSNLLLGFTGLMSFAQGGSFGLGAYVAGLSRVHLDAGLLAVLAASASAGALAAAAVGWIAIRRHGIYFVMLTLAFAQLFYFLAYAFPGITGGENGLQGVTRPAAWPASTWLPSLADNRVFYAFSALVFVTACAGLARLTNSPFGRVLVAIRENERRAAAVGHDVRVFKIIAFSVAGALAGIAGAVQALFLGLASISNVEILMSQEIVMMSIIGGANTLFGAFVGAAFVTGVSSILSAWWPRWLLLLGMLLVAVVLFLPSGIMGGAKALAGRWRRPDRASDARRAHP
jgi:branched-chain amino acid transport system permease protein